MRIPAPAALAAWFLLLASTPAGAQVKAPTLVEGDLPAESHPTRASAPSGPGVPAGTVAPSGSVAPAVRVIPAPTVAPAGTVAAPGAGTPSGSDARSSLQRPIEPVSIAPSHIDDLWGARRRALREQDAGAARSALRSLLGALRELGVESMPFHAAVEARDSARALAVRAPDDALEHARAAVALAPGLPEAHLALARVLLASDPGHPGPAFREALVALEAARNDPAVSRAVVGDLAGAALLAVAGAAVIAVLLLLLARLRLFLHDFRHLPVVRGGTPGQALALALALLALPVVLGLGVFAALWVAALASWAWLSRSERIAVTAALALVVALPWLAVEAARASAWPGTLAAQVHAIETGWPVAPLVRDLEVRAARERLPAPALLAIGRWHKRVGDLPAARRWYEEALAADPRSAEAQVDLGNALLLAGDLEGARGAYLAAIDRARDLSTVAAAQYDLSKLHLRQAAVELSSDARRKAAQADAPFIARRGSDDDFRANAWLVDAHPPQGALEELAVREADPASVGRSLLGWLAGPFPREAWPVAPLAMVATLWIFGLAVPRLHPCSACARCGRPACRRCQPAAGDSCGQCVNAFLRKDAVDPRDRERKEAEVRRHAVARRWVPRVLALVGGGAGDVVDGRPLRGLLLLVVLGFLALLATCGLALLPLPYPVPPLLRLGVALPPLALLYGLTVRSLFRRTGRS